MLILLAGMPWSWSDTPGPKARKFLICRCKWKLPVKSNWFWPLHILWTRYIFHVVCSCHHYITVRYFFQLLNCEICLPQVSVSEKLLEVHITWLQRFWEETTDQKLMCGAQVLSFISCFVESLHFGQVNFIIIKMQPSYFCRNIWNRVPWVHVRSLQLSFS